MKQDTEMVLKVTKEIIIKFIETGRVSPGSFKEIFQTIYEAINETINEQTGTNADK